MVGSGGVGAAWRPIAARREFYEHIVFADLDPSRSDPRGGSILGAGGKFSATTVDASDAANVAECIRANDITHVLNAADPRTIRDAHLRRGVRGRTLVLDMAMSLSTKHPDAPYERVGKKLGDDQFAVADRWVERGLLAIVGMGVEPGLADVFARYASDCLFSSIDEIGVHDGSDLRIDGVDFAPTFRSGRRSRSA